MSTPDFFRSRLDAMTDISHPLAALAGRQPCDATQIGRFGKIQSPRRAIGEDGLDELIRATIETAVGIKALKPTEFERVIVDTTVQEKAIALKQTLARQGKQLRHKAGGYEHAKQFRRRRRTVAVLGVVMREEQRKLEALGGFLAAGQQSVGTPPQP